MSDSGSASTHQLVDESPKSVVARALSLLDAFGPEDVELSLTDLCERTGLPKTTVHRFVGELVSWGALERGQYGLRLGIRLCSLGDQVARVQQLRDLSAPFLADLYQATNESAHLAVLDGTEVLYLAKVSGHGSTPTLSRIGGRLPSHCTGVGKALLSVSPHESLKNRVDAGLPRLTPHTVSTPGSLQRDINQTRERGYSIDREETRMGIVSLAAPVFDRRGEAVAAIAIAGRTHNIRIDRMAELVKSTAAQLSKTLASPHV